MNGDAVSCRTLALTRRGEAAARVFKLSRSAARRAPTTR